MLLADGSAIACKISAGVSIPMGRVHWPINTLARNPSRVKPRVNDKALPPYVVTAIRRYEHAIHAIYAVQVYLVAAKRLQISAEPPLRL